MVSTPLDHRELAVALYADLIIIWLFPILNSAIFNSLSLPQAFQNQPSALSSSPSAFPTPK